jgi:AcrR family transcriptional regulator
MARQPRWQRRKEDRPTEILEAALEVFASRGYSAARLDDVAAGAGISKGTLYLYFKNKEELFKAVVRHHILANLAEAETLVQGSARATPELMKGVLMAFGTALTTTRAGVIPKLIVAESGNFPDLARFYAEEVVGRGFRLIAALLERGKARGDLRAVDGAVAPPVIMGPMLLLALWKNVFEPHAEPKLDPQQYLSAYLDILFNGLVGPETTTGD